MLNNAQLLFSFDEKKIVKKKRREKEGKLKMLEGRKEGLEPPPPLPAYKSILADCQLRQVDVYSRFIAGFIRGLKARAEILPLAHDPTHGDRLCNKLVLSSLPVSYTHLTLPTKA